MAGRALPLRARARTLGHPARAAKRSIFFVTLADMGAANSRVRGHSQRWVWCPLRAKSGHWLYVQQCNLPIEWLDPKKVTKPKSHNALVRGLRYVGHTFRFGSSDFRRSKSRRSPSEPLIQSVRFDQAGHHFAGVCTLLPQGRQ